MKSKLNRVISISFICAFLFTAFSLIPLNGHADCVNCTSGSDEECIRVIVGNTVHIFHGKRSNCE